MKVFHVITSLDVGGAEMMLYKLLRGFGDGVQNEVVALGRLGPVATKIAAVGVPLRSLNMRRSVFSLPKIFRLARWIAAAKPDVVQTWMYHADLVGGVAAMLSGSRPIIWNLQATLAESEGESWSTAMVVRACARLSGIVPDAIIGNSHLARAQHIELGYPQGRFVVIPAGFDIDLFRPDDQLRKRTRQELGVDSETVLIGQIARFAVMKDHRNFISAAAHIHRVQPGTRFLMCGEGMTARNEELSGWLREAGMTDSFLLAGRRDDVADIMRATDIVVSPSAFGEGFPNIIGEAMASGTPCVVTDVGDSAHAVGETGLVVPPRDPDALGRACLQLVESGAEARNALGQRARERVRKHFSLPAVVQQYREFYEASVRRARNQSAA